ncbi:CoA ester lyase [Amycolatopsis sp. RM579]|uniref:CoA ester lyase n=2 Tax=Amycolatopsis pithecellobii TaxID=664692 RepID=A0A6N7YU29_9PSEU|nr:CoA ester lyase [Amycolatopsis pithecellobii]
MKPYRSMLFVPGHKESWADKGVAAGADALILDLEDAVPADLKAEARQTVSRTSRRLAAGGRPYGVWVRPNSWDSGLVWHDLAEVVCSGIDGLVLPKVETSAEIHYFDGVVTSLEALGGVEQGRTKFLLTLETAKAIAGAAELATASPRVVSMLGGTGPHGDIARALGYIFTAEGLETLYARSKILLACRTAGLDHPVCGLWQDVRDVVGLRDFLGSNRQLGYRGAMVIHPSHVHIANEVFTPSATEFAFYEEVVAQFDAAVVRGDAALVVGGQHVDLAHAKTARQWLEHWGWLREGQRTEPASTTGSERSTKFS